MHARSGSGLALVAGIVATLYGCLGAAQATQNALNRAWAGLGLIAWIYLLALITVLSAEINVVAQRHLWPPALLPPFTDDVQLTLD